MRCAPGGSRRSVRQVSTEALQQAALGKVSGKVTQWLKSHGPRPQSPRRATIARGAWLERAVETVFGSYLEAVCVDGLDAVAVCWGVRRRTFAVVSRAERRPGGAAERRGAGDEGARRCT